MKSATIRDVQHHLARVLHWVQQGETVEVTRRKQAIARIVPVQFPPAAARWPNRIAERQAVYGDARVPGPSGADLIGTDRERDL